MRTRLHISVLLLASFIGLGVGLGLLLTPASFQSSIGLSLADATALSEARAPGGALVALSILTGIGAIVRAFRAPATLLAAAVYLAYGLARVLSLVIDGVPHSGIVAAMAIELAVGVACLVFVQRPGTAAVAA